VSEVFVSLHENAKVHKAEDLVPSFYQIRYNKQWRRSAEQLLAICEQEGVDPEAFVRAQTDNLFSFLKRKKLRFVPGMLFGPKAVARYNEWLTSKTRRRGGIPDENVQQVKATEIYLKTLFRKRKLPLSARKNKALRASRKFLPGFVLASRTTRIALVNFAASLHPDLPDRVALRKGGKLATLVSGLVRLARSTDGEAETETRQRVRKESRRGTSP
jgi:hypothetical protein